MDRLDEWYEHVMHQLTTKSLKLTLYPTPGETWNLMKIGYQLKQVRERLAKGLVDKGILRTEKRNFLLFDMATHPVADGGAKDEIRRRVRNVLTNRTVVLPPSQFLPEDMEFRYMRTIAMVCAAYAANVLENALATLGHEARERAFAQVDELLAEYSQWPFGKRAGGSQGIGANLGQVITDEINKSKDKELQLEASSRKPNRQTNKTPCADVHNHFKGGGCLLERLYSAGLAIMMGRFLLLLQVPTPTTGNIRPGQDRVVKYQLRSCCFSGRVEEKPDGYEGILLAISPPPFPLLFIFPREQTAVRKLILANSYYHEYFVNPPLTQIFLNTCFGARKAVYFICSSLLKGLEILPTYLV